MHFHADHALWFERPPAVGRAASSLSLTMAVLLLNAGANLAAGSAVLAGVGMILLVVARVRGHRRIEPALAWTVAVVALVMMAGMLQAPGAPAIQVGARVICGVVWVLWLGTQVDWASLRQLLLRLRVPDRVVSVLDHALMHGVLTQREWARRRDAARLRVGASRIPLTAWGPLLGEGALHAFMRLEHVEESAVLRASAVLRHGDEGGIRLDGVRVERAGETVLEPVDLDLPAGSWTVVCGPSGSGKSSLLRLLAGLDAPATGTLRRLGSAVVAETALRDRLDGRVALLSQNPEHHFIASTVAQDIAWGLVHRGTQPQDAQQRTAEMACALGIHHLLDRPCHALSFGEQRRVALAGLLVLEPAWLLLDEPTSGLDPVAAHTLRTLVDQVVRQTGAACIWATHDLHSLPLAAQRVVLLGDRRVLFDGPITEGLSRPWLLRAGLAVPHKETAC